MNPAVNARDAMPNGGSLTITCRDDDGGDESGLPGNYVRISIADTGEGMTEETLAKAREPFTTKGRERHWIGASPWCMDLPLNRAVPCTSIARWGRERSSRCGCPAQPRRRRRPAASETAIDPQTDKINLRFFADDDILVSMGQRTCSWISATASRRRTRAPMP